MEHQPETTVEPDGDLFAQPAHFGDSPIQSGRKRRTRRAKQKRALHKRSEQPMIDEALLQGFHIYRYVWQFRHWRRSGLAGLEMHRGALAIQVAGGAAGLPYPVGLIVGDEEGID